MDEPRRFVMVHTIEPAVLAIVTLLSLMTLWLATLPGYFDEALLWLATVVCWVILAVVWFVDVALAAKHRSEHVWRRWLVAPAVAIVVAFVSLSLWPDRLRFVVSERALDRAADRVEAGAQVQGRVGRYEVQSSSVTDGHAMLAIGSRLMSSWVLVRAPAPPSRLACDHLAARWYLCTSPWLD